MSTWIETAKRALIEEGISGVKVDRLANRLGVSRGGFYHYFGDRDALLDKLIEHWEQTCHFLPDRSPGTTPKEAVAWLDEMSNRLIDEDGYDPQFDMAMREWARSDRRAEWAVERADRDRLTLLEKEFGALGYGGDEQKLRARVYYYHQMGYYAIGVREPISERRRNASTYHEILFGAERLAQGRDAARRRKAG